MGAALTYRRYVRARRAVREPARRPARTVVEKAAGSVSRWAAGSTGRARRSDREALAALAAAGGEDRPARAGAHPQAEPVRLVTTTVVRLVRPLAHEVFSSGWAVLHGLGPTGSHLFCRALLSRTSVPGSDRDRGAWTDRPTVRGPRGQGQTADAPPSPACGQSTSPAAACRPRHAAAPCEQPGRPVEDGLCRVAGEGYVQPGPRFPAAPVC